MFITEDLIIELGSGPGPGVTNTSGTNTVDWEDSVVSDVSSGGGDDQITGNTFGNQLSGNLGADTIFGMEGNDEIDVMDATPDDSVDCGENLVGDTDNDFVLHDPGDTINPNCEVTSTQP